ncbi:MAG TPA: Sapep family Mn(2+)-dependent dipeptidase [Bryobacteraceae bacterium]|nr:Sapep family Mn(2+)-dependent dipeptidase [Bryobacteraceae bacterium]
MLRAREVVGSALLGCRRASARRRIAGVIALALTPLCLFAQAADETRRIYHQRYAARMEPLLCEVVGFRTEAGHPDAVSQQARWIERQAQALGLIYREAGPVTEVELAGPPGAPVLGLVVHGDIQPAGESEWTVPPFSCTRKDAYIYGRGVADDKGPLVQALLAMAALRDSRWPLTHTIRLLVGSDEESTNLDIATYLKSHRAPDLSLVLDSAFPVVVGEKAWDRLDVTAADPYRPRGTTGVPPLWEIIQLDAGIGASIVPPRATARLRRVPNLPVNPEDIRGICPISMPQGYRCEAVQDGSDIKVTVTGRAAHAGVNIEGGRNALVALANIIRAKTVFSGARDLLEFASIAGKDLYGTGLGLTANDPLWGRYAVNVATLKPAENGALTLAINLRRPPPTTHQQIQAYLRKFVTDFNREHHTSLEFGGYFQDEPLSFDPNSKIVKRLVADYARATGQTEPPAISGGATYAKRLPHAIAFGMWFPGKPYPGHDVDERILVADLDRGVDVLLEALGDIACSPPIREPFRP